MSESHKSQSDTSTLTLQEAFDSAYAGDLVTNHYGCCPHQVLPGQKARIDAAMKDGYITVRDSEMGLSNTFFIWCEIQGHPFIKIKPRTKYATVSMDFIAAPTRLSGQGVRMVEDLFNHHMPRAHSNPHAGETYSFAERIPMSAAPEVAAQLVRISREPANLISLDQWREQTSKGFFHAGGVAE